MRVKVLVSFSDQYYRVKAEQGQILSMPPGADWIKAGLVEAIEQPKTTRTKRKPRTATKPKGENTALS